VGLQGVFGDDEAEITEAVRVGDDVDGDDPVSAGGEVQDDSRPAAWHPDRRRRAVEERGFGAVGAL
jgi:hypothetical protein